MIDSKEVEILGIEIESYHFTNISKAFARKQAEN